MPGQRRAALDIAIAGLRPTRGNAEGDQPPGRGRRQRGSDRGEEAVGRADVVIGGQHQQQRFRIALAENEGGGGGGRRGVAADRLEHDRLGLDRQVAQLLGDQEAMILVADQQRRGEAGRIADPLHRRLQQADIGDQRHDLLRIGGTRQRPQPRAGAARENHRMDHRASPGRRRGRRAAETVPTCRPPWPCRCSSDSRSSPRWSA